MTMSGETRVFYKKAHLTFDASLKSKSKKKERLHTYIVRFQGVDCSLCCFIATTASGLL